VRYAIHTTTRRAQMKNKLTKFIFPLLFLAGLSLLLYPLVSNEWNSYRQTKLISSYEDVVTQ
jgi:sortase A